MDTASIQSHLNSIVLGMVAKGLVKPDARFTLSSDTDPHLFLSWDKVPGATGYNRDHHSCKGATPLEMLVTADEFVAALPSREETKLRNFMDALGNVIDLGRANGIDVAFVNPLTETMKKLSENALTYQRQAAE